jgi:hypothetical protein
MQRHLHGPRALKCKETLTLTLGGSERRASDAEASARVQDPEARKKIEGLEVQGTQYVGASNGEETLTLGAKQMRTSSAAASARVEDPECTGAQGPEVQGTLEGAEIVVLSSASIASTKEVELSTNVLELICEAGRKNAPLKRQTGDSEANVAEDFEAKNDLLFYEIDG